MADDPIEFDAMIERLAPEVPRFVVFPGNAWDETATLVVEVTLDGHAIGRRTLVPWKERGWSMGLSEPMCRKAGVDTGDRVRITMRRVEDPIPAEVKELIASDRRAAAAWKKATPAQQRMFALWVAEAKRPETRLKRARSLQRPA